MTYDVHIPQKDGTVKVQAAGDYRHAVLIREAAIGELSSAEQLTVKLLGREPFIVPAYPDRGGL